MISFRHLSTGYFSRSSSVIVSANINGAAEEGELVALIGLNGSGKSTLLKTLASLQSPIEGDIQVLHKPLKVYTAGMLARTIAFVSSSRTRSPAVTVKEMVELGRYPYTNWLGSMTEMDEKQVMDALSMVHAEHMAEKNLNQISDGEFQRVHIARALCQDTPIIILDEPTAFLDIINRYEIIVLLRDLCRLKNKTILFSTHEWSAALQLADRVWYLHEGNLTEGAPEDILMTRQLDALFAGKDFYANPETGEIRFTERSVCSIALEKKVVSNPWLLRAMKRVGIVNDPNARARMSYRQNHWVLDFDGNSYHLSTILELLVTMKKTGLLSPGIKHISGF